MNQNSKDGRAPNLVIKGCAEEARHAAQQILEGGKWPVGYWRDGGLGAFRAKIYLKDVKKGIVPMTYWGDDEFDSPDVLGALSWCGSACKRNPVSGVIGVQKGTTIPMV